MENFSKLFRAFALTATAVFCAAAIFAGAVTVRARAQKTIDGSRYAVAAVRAEGESFEIETEKNNVIIKIPTERLWQKLKTLLPFTPAGSVLSFFETVIENR